MTRIGPHLIGVVRRTAGTVPGFSYSDALANSGIVWTEADLDAFLADPRGLFRAPGWRLRASMIRTTAPLPRAERALARRVVRDLPALTLERSNLLPVGPIARLNEVWAWASAAEMALRFAGLPPLSAVDTYRCRIVTARFGSCEPDCATCLNPVRHAGGLVAALNAYQDEALAQGLIDAPAIEPAVAGRLGAAALRTRIRNQRSPVLAQLFPRDRSFYPAALTSHFAQIVGIAGSGRQAVLTVDDPCPYAEAANPYLATGARTGGPGQYTISYGDFRRLLGYRRSVVFR